MGDVKENSLRPIGVFDSGVGGISVLRELVALMPNENYIFYGDSKNAPYGTKTLAEVQKVDEKSGIVTVKPFPLIDGEQDKNVDCYACLMPKTVNESIEWVGIESSLSMHDIVIVAFLNRDSEQSYRQTKKSMKRTALKENSDLHSDKYGFIIGICWKHIEKEESK